MPAVVGKNKDNFTCFIPGHQRLQELSEGEEYQSGNTDEEIGETEERNNEFDGYFHHRDRQKSGEKQRSFETNEEESDFVEDEMGSNEDMRYLMDCQLCGKGGCFRNCLSFNQDFQSQLTVSLRKMR